MSRRGDKNGDIKLRGQFDPGDRRDDADASMDAPCPWARAELYMTP